jgi:dihydroorotate dehydrogenase
MSNAYERFVRPLLFSFDAESSHDFAIGLLQAASHFDPALQVLKSFYPPIRQPKTVFGIEFPNPIGLAAGIDKNGVALPAWETLGFGFIEIGTITARPQPGNPKPRIFRLSEQQALINRLGFNNEGADAVAQRLHYWRTGKRRLAVPLGINIGKSRLTPLEHVVDDYVYSFRVLRKFADYIVLNVSSPNTPGLRELQGPAALSTLLDAIGSANRTNPTPLVIKIAPDLTVDQLGDIISVCEEKHVAAIVATNTTTDHSSIPQGLDQEGGLSGSPLRGKSTDLVRSIADRSSIPVIAAGGILDATSALEKIEAGAQLLQIYTGYIYRGPGLLKEIGEALVRQYSASQTPSGHATE